MHKPDRYSCRKKLKKSHKLEFENYHFLRQDRPNTVQGGSEGILTKKSIKFETKRFNCRNSAVSIETCSVIIKGVNNERLILVSIYALQGDYAFIHDLDHIFKRLDTDNLNNYHVITGRCKIEATIAFIKEGST